MLHRLAEAEARVQHYLDSAHARALQTLQSLNEKAAHFLNHILVNGIHLHRLRRSLHVHADVAGLRLGHDAPHFIIGAVRRNVVHDAGAGSQRGAGHRRFSRVDGNGHLHPGHQLLDHRQHTAQFLGVAHRLSTGPRRFAADVNDLRSLPDHFQATRYRGRRIKKPAAVRKRIGRHVHHTHNHCRTRERERKLAGAKNHDAGREKEQKSQNIIQLRAANYSAEDMKKTNLRLFAAPIQRLIIWLTPSTSRRAMALTSSLGTPICGLALWLSMWHWSLT